MCSFVNVHLIIPIFIAPDQKPKNQVVQYYQQATADQPLLDAPGDPQNLNVYNVQVQKSHKDNKVSGHMGPHSVSVSMQGPGTVSLDTSQLNVHPEDQQPDHTITMIKDSGACPQCSSVNVQTGRGDTCTFIFSAVELYLTLEISNFCRMGDWSLSLFMLGYQFSWNIIV